MFTFAAPTGTYYLRMRSMSGADVSLPSNEIRVFVGVPTTPSAPANFQAMVKGSTLWMAWQNTFGGGQPASIVMDVTGTATASIALPLAESYTIPGIPNGTFTLRLRATNGAGTSAQSNSVTITGPSTSCALPRVPGAYQATRVGNTVVMSWDPPSGGTPASSYVITVSGSYNGAFPVASRSFAAAAPPGTYVLSVRAANVCGAGPATAFQTVTIP